LYYRLKSGEGFSYQNPPPLKVSQPEFDATLEGGVLMIEMKEHHPTVASAMERVRAFLDGWEISGTLEQGRGRLSFEFERPEVIDRNPPPPGARVIVEAVVSHLLLGSAFDAVEVVSPRYPKPPVNFVATETVRVLFERYQLYRDRKDLLTTMGFACLALLTHTFGKKESRTKAANKYQIEKAVLDKLAYLTSNVGDHMNARKFDGDSEKRPHTQAEITWIEAAVTMLIRRVGEHKHDPAAKLPKITMNDLPNLPEP
jgi:hypothetical protein